MIRDFSCGVIPVFFDGKKFQYLVIKHRWGHFGLPKGHKERGESDIETAKREFQEETGIKDFEIIFPEKRFEDHYIFKFKGKTISKKVVYFLALVFKKDFNVQKEEIDSAYWVNYNEAYKILTFRGIRNILKNANKFLLENKDTILKKTAIL